MSLTLESFAPLETETAALIEHLQQSVVVIQTRGGAGSGVIWSSEGLIVTNHHVAPRERALVELSDGAQREAAVVAHDPHNDLALLQIDTRGLKPGRFVPPPVGDSEALRVGEIIIAIGHPLGIRGTATFGIVSAQGQRWALRGQRDREVLHADVVLAPGNSGGPLVNARGEIVGIASMILSPGIAIAVPSHVVTRFVQAATARSAARRKAA